MSSSECYSSEKALSKLLFGVTRHQLNDSRAPNPLETPPIEYILR